MGGRVPVHHHLLPSYWCPGVHCRGTVSSSGPSSSIGLVGFAIVEKGVLAGASLDICTTETLDAPFLTLVYVPVPIPIDDALKSSAPTFANSSRVFTCHFYLQRRFQHSRTRSDAFGTPSRRFSKMTWPIQPLRSYQS